jgi:hypothetical protein
MARKKTQGIIRSDKEIEALAKIADEDIRLAEAWFKNHAKPQYRNLLDAKAKKSREE